ncbi:hypothetical protein HEP22_023245 [Escherichia coli]|uniref:hypothetical protein n=1 Tax=Escherichia coli TaxID=562 RepID=UPI0012FF6E3E|nr:hypothetical protein [Escherichia coli]EIG1236914.1 hypothetical protein [Escherichia coli]EJK1461713.1 hypothetical protein [Escherichia coli]ELE3012546.1 hypothetical protein [Escherichia coli]MBB7538232.1 hypothetical protein [Escherichia coli]MBB7900328.1 hypothetical protein [Escherichia coli]
MSFLDAKSYDTLFGLPELYEDALPRFSLSCEDIAFARTVDEEKPASNITPNTANDLARRFMVFYRTVLHPFFPE